MGSSIREQVSSARSPEGRILAGLAFFATLSNARRHQNPCATKTVASKVKRLEDIPVTKEFEDLANIEDVRAGDYVLTRDEHTEKSSYRKVTELFRHEVKLLYRIVLSDGTRLDTTWNHPFFVWGTGIGDQCVVCSPEKSCQKGVKVERIKDNDKIQFGLQEKGCIRDRVREAECK